MTLPLGCLPSLSAVDAAEGVTAAGQIGNLLWNKRP
jgi:hypothetical protein